MRQEVLCCILNRQYGVLLDLPEAITAVRSEGLLFQGHKEKAIALLESWRRRKEISELTWTPSTRIDEPGSVIYIRNCISFWKTMRRMHRSLRGYNLLNGKMKRCLSSCPILKKSSFLRALCPLQTLANIFGVPERGLDLS